MFSESLTVRILGDSSALRREIDNAISQIDRLEDRLGAAVNVSNRLSQSLKNISGSLGPLRQLITLLTQVNQQLTAISRRPVTLNVIPAINALQRLAQAAQMAAAAISSIMGGIIGGFSVVPGFPGNVGGGGGGNINGGGGSRTGYATGGLVAGPTGIDRVETRLTSGEYVINREAVLRYGVSYFDQLNQQAANVLASPSHTPTASRSMSPTQLLANPSFSSRGQITSLQLSPTASLQSTESVYSLQNLDQSRQLTSASHQSQSHKSMSSAWQSAVASPVNHSVERTENHFGGITVNMQTNADLDSFFRDLRSQAIGLRYRRG